MGLTETNLSFLSMDAKADLGSFNSNEPKYEGQRSYYGLSKDITKFKANCNYVYAGSLAFCVDTGECYMFEESNNTWYKQ